ncbi:hypothetical protein IVB03_39550 [Bradyrhizobium sp. 168]|uniref:phage tail tip lysozyme n=1 Tax=Bradyrhizobium sp. 168 TaxID=2782639 RepID=UPI001FFBACA2|nr:phage tail tip lysozyme [Bradyrhizobium sp. 168]MCK1585492.1 hypothetical protein [Bradyrhizobium sp. 168]
MAIGTGLPVPKDNTVLTQAPGGVSGAQLFDADSWSRIAAAGSKLADSATDYLKVSEHKAQVGYLADQDVEITRKQIELRDKHAFNPGGFDAEWNGYAEGKLSEAAPWAVPQIRVKLGQSGNTAYSSVLNETRTRSDTEAKSSWGTLEDQSANDVYGSAMAGTLSTPEGQAKLAKYRGVVDTGVTSQFITKEAAEQRFNTLQSAATVYATRDHIKQTFDATGPIDAAKEIDGIVRDENLKLSPEQRLTLGSRLRADVHAWDAERQHNLSTVDLEAQSLLKAKQGGVPISQSRLDEVVDRYKRFGGQAQAASFLADAQHSDDLSFLGRVPVGEAAAWVDRYKTERGFNSPPQAAKTSVDFFVSRGWTPAQAQGIVGNLIHESGLNPNAVHDKGTGLGIAGHRLERLDALKAYAASKGTTANDFQTQLEFIDQELKSTESGAGAKLRNAATPEQAAAAFINFERPLGYDPNNLAAAHGYSNRVAQATRLAGGVVPATANDTAFIGKANAVVAKRVSDEADSIIAGMNDKASPVLPSEQRLNDLLSSAAATNTPEVLEKVSRAAGEYQFRRQFGRAPEPQEAGAVSVLQQKAQTEGLSSSDARRLEIAQEVATRTAKALQDDPLAHTISALGDTSGSPPPQQLNVANPADFRAGLQARSQWAAAGTRTFETAPMPALTASDVTQVRAALDAADPAGKARIYGDIVSATSGQTRAATLAKLGAKGVDGMVEAYAGAMAGMDPAVGESIIRGQSAMKLKDAYNPMKDGNKDESNSAIDKYLPAGAFTLAARTDPQGAYAVMRGAVVARVADLAATNPNFDGKFGDALFQRAVADVTGGVVTHNGASLITPIRGMNQRQFDAKMAGLADQDLQGVTTLSGTPVTAEYVRNNAQLESLSDGRYLLRLGRDPERPIYAFRNLGVQGQPMKPFALDLRQIAPNTSLPDPMALSSALP